MLQLVDIKKSYTTGSFTQQALAGVSLTLRDNEFVAILGPSGSGKTTLLNVLGGLDHYDSGNLIIDGVATEDYSARDWDTYRNIRIGFVFQSYNLIPHQSVLANVELALTLAGVSRAERHERARKALHDVGLAAHAHKLPNQLSGGQAQRVAIARALINDPEILLADEPTGALDSETSTQIMNLLSEIARDRLVVMVTHNPELAHEYATRIIELHDGKITNDTAPYQAEAAAPAQDKLRHRAMSFLTALGLSFQNLMTKKGRTVMTAFAGSIGIIGIATILSLANGVNNYIKGIEEDTLTMYPLSIMSQGFDLGAMMNMDPDAAEKDYAGEIGEVPMLNKTFSAMGANDLKSLKKFLDSGSSDIAGQVQAIEYYYNITPQIYLPDTSTQVHQVNPDRTMSAIGLMPQGESSNEFAQQWGGTNSFLPLMSNPALVQPYYDVVAGNWPTAANELLVVVSDNGTLPDATLYALGLLDPAELDEILAAVRSGKPVPEAPAARTFTYEQVLAKKFQLVNPADYYAFNTEYGVWQDRRNDETFLANLVNNGRQLKVAGIVQPSDSKSLTPLMPGIYYTQDLVNEMIDYAAGTDIVADQLATPELNVFTGQPFTQPQNENFDMSKLVTIDQNKLANAFRVDESQIQIDPSILNLTVPDLQFDPAQLPDLDLSDITADLDLSGILDIPETAPGEEDAFSQLATAYIQFAVAGGHDPMDVANTLPLFLESDAGQAAIAATGIKLDLSGVEQQLQTALGGYLEQVLNQYATEMSGQLTAALTQQLGNSLTQTFRQISQNMAKVMRIDEAAFRDAFQFNLTPEELQSLLVSMLPNEMQSYDNNLRILGYATADSPNRIDLFPKDFESKARIVEILDGYNQEQRAHDAPEKVITYTDFVGALMSSVTKIINTISYVLIAFVSISLIVSSIMIGIITYVSVLERRKEIGILRAVGASKRDIARVFNAETLLVGLAAGLGGILVTVLLTIPANLIVDAKLGVENIAQLPASSGLILVLISMGLSLLAGIIPASKASREDPVAALRSE
ncbi:MAG: ABC transporter ATP-binding protein/permease [Trueperella sp.]|nr:ABC transporter ATP-binding protein/permease [Trueperella sp.]